MKIARHTIRVLLAVFVTLVLMLPFAQSAAADRIWPIQRANPGLSEEVVRSLPEIVKNSNVKVAPDFVAGTPIAYPNGELVPGQSAKTVAAALACTEQVYSAASGYWGPVAISCTSIFGSPGYEVVYKWQATTGDVATKGVVRVRGFSSGTTEYWKSNGQNIGYETRFITVTWGNVLANLKAQAYKVSGGFAFTAHFWH